MALNEADRHKLAEIERRLEQDPTMARAFGRPRRTPWTLAGPILCAALAYLACLVTAYVVTGHGIPVLLALPPLAVTVVLLHRPGLFRLPVPRRRQR